MIKRLQALSLIRALLNKFGKSLTDAFLHRPYHRMISVLPSIRMQCLRIFEIFSIFRADRSIPDHCPIICLQTLPLLLLLSGHVMIVINQSSNKNRFPILF